MTCSRFLREYSFVGTFLWMLLASIFCWSQSPLELSICAAGVGAVLGATLAYFAKDLKWNPWKVWGLGLVLMLGGNWLVDLLRWLKLPSLMLSASWVYSLTDAFFWGWEALLLVFLLRWTSSVKPSLVSMELLVAGGTLVELFAAHRHGFVNRPYAIVDPLWSRGIDPLPVFLAFGALIAILLLILGATHSQKRGRWLDVVGLVLLVGGLFLFAPMERLKDLPKTSEISQSGEDEESRRGGRGSHQIDRSGRGQNGQNSQSGNQQGEGSDGEGNKQGQSGEGQGNTGQDQTDGQSSGTTKGTGGQSGQTGQQSGGQGGDQQQSGGQGEGQDSQQSGEQGEGQDSQQSGEQGGDQPTDGQQGEGDREQPPQDKSPNSGQGGDSDELTFKDASGESNENPPIAVVIFRDDYTPDSGMYYFRQNAFSQYNGAKLVADTSGKYDRDVATEFPGTLPVLAEVPELEKELFRELETRVALLDNHAKPFGLTNPTEWRAIANPDPKRFQKAFEVTSMVMDKPIAEVLGRRAGDQQWSPETWKHYTTGPDDQRYAALLEEIVASFPDAPKDDPLIKALMVKLWLEENGVYSLKSKHEGTGDPTAAFLFGDRTGYCVFFAHAACYLYRTAGMPARTGSGYAVEASQRGNGSSLLIPSKSAHSWPEVYIEGMGWVVLDISPQKTLDPPPAPSDPGLQQMLGEMARQNPEEPPPDPVEDKIDVQEMLRNVARTIAQALPWALLALLLLAYAKKLYRRYEPYLCPEQDLPDSTLRSLLDLLYDAGFGRGNGEPREAFAKKIESVSPSFLRLTKAHLRHRLGNPKNPPNFPWKKTFLDARAEIRRNAESKNLLKGMFNPITWMKVH